MSRDEAAATAFELSPTHLRALTDAAHAQKPGSMVVGEIVNCPDRWLRSLDAVMNVHLPAAVKASPPDRPVAARMRQA